MVSKYAKVIIECPYCERESEITNSEMVDGSTQCPICLYNMEFEPIKKDRWGKLKENAQIWAFLVSFVVVGYTINFFITMLFLWLLK